MNRSLPEAIRLMMLAEPSRVLLAAVQKPQFKNSEQLVVVLCYLKDRRHHHYATWLLNLTSDVPPFTFHGEYFEDEVAAYCGFMNRLASHGLSPDWPKEPPAEAFGTSGHLHSYIFSTACGVDVCTECGHHKGLTRCYCGWSLLNPGQGRQELLDMGERIDPDV